MNVSYMNYKGVDIYEYTANLLASQCLYDIMLIAWHITLKPEMKTNIKYVFREKLYTKSNPTP